mgnify:CR=1 FL=1
MPLSDDYDDHEFSNLRVIGDRLRANAQIEETETRSCGVEQVYNVPPDDSSLSTGGTSMVFLPRLPWWKNKWIHPHASITVAAIRGIGVFRQFPESIVPAISFPPPPPRWKVLLSV